MKRQLGWIGGITAFAVLFSAMAMTSQAQWKESDPIRVGIFSLGNFQGFDENGEAFGYNIEYLNRLAELKHWSYQYVELENWVEAVNELERGTIDLLAPAQNIPSLNGRFS